MDPYYGLSWRQDEGDFGELEDLRPVWTVEPNAEAITKIARCKLDVPAESQCTVEFLAQGAFNKVYTIQCDDNKEYIMRVTLPVRPRLKTMSDCGTIQYVRHHTDIPAPRVLHYNVLRNDEVGFEWMIQERVLGSSLKSQWHHISWLEKELVVRQVIGYLSQLSASASTVWAMSTTRETSNSFLSRIYLTLCCSAQITPPLALLSR